MAYSVMWKACQRRLYSWLSSKCGLPICVVGVLLIVISALQFGEVNTLTLARVATQSSPQVLTQFL